MADCVMSISISAYLPSALAPASKKKTFQWCCGCVSGRLQIGGFLEAFSITIHRKVFSASAYRTKGTLFFIFCFVTY